MDQISTKTWTVIGTIGVVLFCSYWMRLGIGRTAWAPAAAAIFSYEMPRPKNFDPGFDISDRGVDRQYTTHAQLSNGKSEVKAVPPKITPQKNAAAKAATLKADLAKKAFAAKAAAHQKAAALRKKKAAVEVVDTSRKQTMTAVVVNTQIESPYQGGGGRARPAVKNPEVSPIDKDDQKDEEDGLSVAQWRTLMQLSPTPQNVARFVKAKHDGKIDSTSAFQIVHELLVDSAEDRRKAGLAIIDASSSATTFAFLVTEAEQAPTDVQPQLKSRTDGYTQPAKLGFLNQILNSSEPLNVLTAATVRLTKALAEYKQLAENQQTTGPESGNSPPTNPTQVAGLLQPVRRMAGGLTAQHFLAFVSTLQKIAKQTNSTLAAQATSLLSEIQALTKSPK